MLPVFYGGKQVGRVGYSHNETVLTVKLRLQEQMGFPVAGLDFKSDGKSVANDKDVGYSEGIPAMAFYGKAPENRRIDVL